MLTEEQYQNRRFSLGASDVPRVVLPSTESPYGTPLHVWAEKLGLVPRSPMTAPQKMGLKMERVIAELFAEETGWGLTESQQTIRHPTIDWLSCTPDWLVTDNGEPVDCKNMRTGEGWGEPWTDEVPAIYLIQSQIQQEVLGVKCGYLAVLVGGNDFRAYRINHSEDLMARIVAVCADFWDLVQRRARPPADWTHPGTTEIMAIINRPEPGVEIDLDAQGWSLAERYQTLGGQIKDLEKEREVCKGMLIEKLGTASIGRLPDGRVERRITPGGHVSYDRKEGTSFNIYRKKGKNHET